MRRYCLCIDYKQNGIGQNSCGPLTQEEYRFGESEFEFKIRIEIKMKQLNLISNLFLMNFLIRTK